MTNTVDTTILIRTDADREIGNGHVMRCLALAQAWQDTGGEAVFSMATQSPSIEARLKNEKIALVNVETIPGSLDDARRLIELARLINTSVVVVDGYHFDAQYQLCLKEAGLFLIFIDDYGHADYYWADLILNQNLYANEDFYKECAPYTRLLLGTRYALLRREFNAWRTWDRDMKLLANRVLITLGGGEQDTAVLEVFKAFRYVENDSLEAILVSGQTESKSIELGSVARGLRTPIRIVNMAQNMADLMAWADVAISAAGGTSWELAFMGLPTLLIVLRKNQEAVAMSLESAGAARYLGWSSQLEPIHIADALERLLRDQDGRREMSRRLKEIVDGQGPARVLSAIKDAL